MKNQVKSLIKSEAYAGKGQYSEAIKVLEDHLQTLGEDDKKEKGLFYTCIGNIYLDIGNIPKAKEYFKIAEYNGINMSLIEYKLNLPAVKPSLAKNPFLTENDKIRFTVKQEFTEKDEQDLEKFLEEGYILQKRT